MNLSQLTDSELQQLSNVGNFAAMGELANRRNAIVRNLEIDPQGDIKTFNMSQGTLKSNRVENNDLESQNDGAFIPEEEKGIFSLRDILADLGRKGVEGFKDVAGRTIASNVGTGAGGMLLGPMGALVGGLAGLFKGGDMFKQSYDPFYKQFADPSQGGAGFKDRYGINTVSAFGDYGKYALDKAYGVNALTGDKGDFYKDVVAKKNAAMIDANVGFGDQDSGGDGGYSQSSVDAGVQAAEDDR